MSGSNARSRSVEQTVAELSALPLLRESVYHAPQYSDRGVDKEVCDVLLLHEGQGMILSIKAQDSRRDAVKATRWVNKHAAKAISQIAGAHRTFASRETWCVHGALGRTTFKAASVGIVHSLALIDTDHEIAVDLETAVIEKIQRAAPVTLMSIADFLNLVHYLRAWVDLERYLTQRHQVLRGVDRTTLGAERALLGFYTAMRDSFDGCTGIEDAKIVTARGEHVIAGSAFRDQEVALASMIEEFMTGISSTQPTPMPMLGFDGAADVGDLRAQLRGVFTRLTIQERAAIGEQIGHLAQQLASSEEQSLPHYATIRFDRQPDHIFVVVMAAGANESELRASAMDITIAACAHYERTAGTTLVVNEHPGPEIRWDLNRIENVVPTEEYRQVGQEYFGHLRPRKVGVAR